MDTNQADFIHACPPRPGDLAPDFSAGSTLGKLRLSDFKGKWVLLFFMPASFAPVGTSELIALARSASRFDALGVQPMAVSGDSNAAHIAWAVDIAERFGVRIPFPIAQDAGCAIARRWGAIGQSAAFIIDPEGSVRAALHYPGEAGRSVAEVLRLLEALRESDKTGLLTPADWHGGERKLIPAPGTLPGARQRIADGESWYMCYDG